MTIHARTTVVAAVIALGLTRAAGAQVLRAPDARQGFYISAGAGANVVAAWDKGQRLPTAAGVAYTFRLGEMLTDRWGLGLAIEGENTSHGGVSFGLFGLALEGQARLWRHLSARAGVGLAAAIVDDPSRVGDETHGTYGSLLTAALSYRRLLHPPVERRVGRHARRRAVRRAGRRRPVGRRRADVERLLVVRSAPARAPLTLTAEAAAKQEVERGLHQHRQGRGSRGLRWRQREANPGVAGPQHRFQRFDRTRAPAVLVAARHPDVDQVAELGQARGKALRIPVAQLGHRLLEQRRHQVRLVPASRPVRRAARPTPS